MKKKLIIFAIFILLGSLLVNCVSNDRYGVAKDNIIQKVTPGNNLKPEKGITSELLKESGLNPQKTYIYSSKKINYRIVGILDYTYDCSHKKLFTTKDGIARVIPDYIVYANDAYVNWYIISILIFSIISIILCLKRVTNLWFFMVFILIILYSYIIDEYNMVIWHYVLIFPLIVSILFEWIYIEIENRNFLNFLSVFLIISPIIIFYWIF